MPQGLPHLQWYFQPGSPEVRKDGNVQNAEKKKEAR